MIRLNLPEYNFRTQKHQSGKVEIFDEFRKKFLVLTPEEWVRQNFLMYLTKEKNYPTSLIAIEKGIKVVGMQKRFDAVLHNRQGKPIVLIEFKAPEVKIDQKVMEQLSRYNLKLKVDYMIASNGLTHYCCVIDKESGVISFLNYIPDFEELLNKT